MNPVPAHSGSRETSQTLNRRRFLAEAALRAAGLSVALPTLPSLLPSAARAAEHAVRTAPTRMAFLCVPNGVIVDRWRSTGSGRDFQLGASLEPLESFKSELQIVTNLGHKNGTAGGDGTGDHARASATILTGTRPFKTAGSDIRAGVSVDQVAARQIGQETRFASLELSCDGVRKSGGCDSGYSCAYQFNIAWRSPTQPATPESNPRLVFERLFGKGSREERAANMAARLELDRSILDFVAADARRLSGRLDGADRRKLDEYLTGVREIEQRLVRLERLGLPDVPDRELPDAPPKAYGEYVRLLADMLVLAFQTDSTRVATLLLAHDGSNRTFPEIGVREGHHHLSHHKGDEAMIEKLARIDRFYIDQFAWFLERLRSTPDVDGRSLLANSMIVYTSGLSDGNRHRHDDLPLLLAGRAGGRLAAGQLHDLAEPRPMSDLFVTLLDVMGAPVERFGDSTGRLDVVRA
jgi:hypothetical protein